MFVRLSDFFLKNFSTYYNYINYINYPIEILSIIDIKIVCKKTFCEKRQTNRQGIVFSFSLSTLNFHCTISFCTLLSPLYILLWGRQIPHIHDTVPPFHTRTRIFFTKAMRTVTGKVCNTVWHTLRAHCVTHCGTHYGHDVAHTLGTKCP